MPPLAATSFNVPQFPIGQTTGNFQMPLLVSGFLFARLCPTEAEKLILSQNNAFLDLTRALEETIDHGDPVGGSGLDAPEPATPSKAMDQPRKLRELLSRAEAILAKASSKRLFTAPLAIMPTTGPQSLSIQRLSWWKLFVTRLAVGAAEGTEVVVLRYVSGGEDRVTIANVSEPSSMIDVGWETVVTIPSLPGLPSSPVILLASEMLQPGWMMTLKWIPFPNGGGHSEQVGSAEPYCANARFKPLVERVRDLVRQAIGFQFPACPVGP